MKESRIYNTNFIKQNELAKENSLNFENHTEYTPYKYESKDKIILSELNLYEENNYIITSIIPYLRNHSQILQFDQDELTKYNGNPMKLSMDQYGTVDYWWIIMTTNGYFNPNEFRNFKSLIIPNREDIAVILDKEVFSNKNIGMIE